MVRSNGENANANEALVAMDVALNKRSYIRLASIRDLLLVIERKVVGQIMDRMF